MAESEEFKEFARKLGRRPYRQYPEFTYGQAMKGCVGWNVVDGFTRDALARRDAITLDRLGAASQNTEVKVAKLLKLDELDRATSTTEGVRADNDTKRLKNRSLLTDAQRRELALQIETERHEKSRGK